eukprot:TRINITY_DN6907_c1_g1_i13.p1 TRINITY_DN6907_c1_g1~~TRINITY_DN6907_c1_g1_i13.p1  ORF type:complete len:688 (-),score=183.42 TRINITY_DN6907_c1_g1_i13:17-2080(-)
MTQNCKWTARLKLYEPCAMVVRDSDAETFGQTCDKFSYRFDDWQRLLDECVDEDTEGIMRSYLITANRLPSFIKNSEHLITNNQPTQWDLLQALRSQRHVFINDKTMKLIQRQFFLFNDDDGNEIYSIQLPKRVAIDGPVGNKPLTKSQTEELLQQKNSSAQSMIDALIAELTSRSKTLRRDDFARDVPKATATKSWMQQYDDMNITCGSAEGTFTIGNAADLVSSLFDENQAKQLVTDVAGIPRMESMVFAAVSIGVRTGEVDPQQESDTEADVQHDEHDAMETETDEIGNLGDLRVINLCLESMRSINWNVDDWQQNNEQMQELKDNLAKLPLFDFNSNSLSLKASLGQGFGDLQSVFGQKLGSEQVIPRCDHSLRVIDDKVLGNAHDAFLSSNLYHHHGWFTAGKKEAQNAFMMHLSGMLTRKNRIRDVLREITKHVIVLVEGIVPTTEKTDNAFALATGVSPANVRLNGRVQKIVDSQDDEKEVDAYDTDEEDEYQGGINGGDDDDFGDPLVDSDLLSQVSVKNPDHQQDDTVSFIIRQLLLSCSHAEDTWQGEKAATLSPGWTLSDVNTIRKLICVARCLQVIVPGKKDRKLYKTVPMKGKKFGKSFIQESIYGDFLLCNHLYAALTKIATTRADPRLMNALDALGLIDVAEEEDEQDEEKDEEEDEEDEEDDEDEDDEEEY